MPEGPEVRVLADKIERAVAGETLQACQLLYESLSCHQLTFSAVQLTHIETFGKAFVLHFSNDYCIYVHLQLYGRWQTGPLRSHKKLQRSLRLHLATETHYADLYSATDIELIHKDNISRHYFIKKLGPDILNTKTNIATIATYLEEKSKSRRSLGTLLLDQASFAGIGNYLRSEILFRAKLLHTRKLNSLSTDERENLARMIYETTIRAYQTKGITLDKNYVSLAKEQGLRRSQYRHFVFSRKGKQCWICQHVILKGAAAGRRVYWCPECQQ